MPLMKTYREDNILEYVADLLDSGVKISTDLYHPKNGEVFQLSERDTIKRCYDPDHPVRKYFPRYWCAIRYYKDEKVQYELISIYDRGIQWIKGYENEEGYFEYKWYLYDENGQKIQLKTIRKHNLAGIMDESYRTPRAAELFEEQGVFAFGHRGEGVNGHHQNKNNKDNSPENITFMVELHKSIEKDLSVEENRQELLNDMITEFKNNPCLVIEKGHYDEKGNWIVSEEDPLLARDLSYLFQNRKYVAYIDIDQEVFDLFDEKDKEYCRNFLISVQKLLDM